MRILKNVVLFVFCCCPLFPVKAQLAFDTLSVTALKVPLKIKETGRNITVITAAEIEASPVTSIDEILQSLPGLEVSSRGGFGVQGDISLRGSTFTQVLMLVDGMKLNDALTGHFNSYIPVTISEIERIEVLRGAAAAMYGADAVGGVINIVTKTFSEIEDGTHISGSLNYGDHKLISAQQGITVKKGKSTFGVGFALNQSEGEYIGEKILDSTTSLEGYNNFFDLKTVGLSFSHELKNNLKLRLRSAYDHRDFGARYFYTTSPFDKSTETVANWSNRLQIQRTATSSMTDFNLSYKYNTDEFVFSPDFPSTNNHVTQYLNSTINHQHIFNDQMTVKAGLQVDHRQIESNDRGDHADLHYGIYAMSVYRHDQLNLSLSARGDYDDNYGFEFSPQLNISYLFSSITLRASVGRSIRAADYTERFVSNNLMNLTPGRSLGNPNLAAERGWSEEIGLDYNVSSNWTLKTTLFARQSTDLIDFVSTNEAEIGVISEVGSLQENENYFFAKNITDVKTIGFEFESAVRAPIGNKGSLIWQTGYTFLNTTNDEDVISVYISSHAKHLITSQLILSYDKLDFSLNGIYKERNGRIAEAIHSEMNDAYTVWHGKVSYDITEVLSVNLQLINLFDEAYQNILGATMPGRWVMAGFKWKL